MDHGDFKDLTRRTASDKILHDKAISIASNPKYDVYQRVFVWSINFLIIEFLMELLKMKICQTKGYLKKYINQLLENLKKEKYILLLQTIVGVMILLIVNW